MYSKVLFNSRLMFTAMNHLMQSYINFINWTDDIIIVDGNIEIAGLHENISLI